MSEDWIEVAAKSVFNFMFNRTEKERGEYISVESIAKRIRSHAPPVSEWRERPTCDGCWANMNQGLVEFKEGWSRRMGMRLDDTLLLTYGRWYGPILSLPGATK